MTKEQEQALDNEFKQATKEINNEMAEFMKKYREHQQANMTAEEFTLEKYYSGKYNLKTRDGHDARIICDNVRTKFGTRMLYLYTDYEDCEVDICVHTNGKYFEDERIDDKDLVLISKE